MDDVTFTYIVDGAMWMSPKGFLPAITGSYWLDHPGRISESGLVGMSTGGLLVERAANADAKH
jgi:hypothetical protein